MFEIFELTLGELLNKRIQNNHIFKAVENDEEMRHFFKRTIIPNSGVLPNIEPNLLKGGAYPIITKPAIQRLAFRAGVKRVQGLVYEEIRGVLDKYLDTLLRSITDILEYTKSKTVTKEHVKLGLKRSEGKTILVGGKRKNPGQVSLQNIKKYQKTTHLLIPKASSK